MLFVDGVQLGAAFDVTGLTIFNSGQTLKVGCHVPGGAGYDMDGWIDEVRVSKGIARWTQDFTPPSAPPAAYDQVSRYNPETDSFENYVGNPEFDELSELEYGKGYVIYVDNPQGLNVTVNGTAPAPQNVSLQEGWNLIPYPYLSQQGTQQALAGLELNVDYDSVLSYNSATGGFEEFPGSLDNLQPNKSYYIHCLQSVNWELESLSRTTDFYYDGDGGRVKKVSQIDQGETTIYIGSLFETVTSNQTTETRKHIFAGANRVCVVENSSPKYFHGDHLGSSNVITDGEGNQASRYEYSPFGEVAASIGDPESSIKHLYTGKELDDTGLYYYGARYYDPLIGRFISPDTIVQAPQDPQTLNRYAYCRNNPIKYVDPSGNFFWAAIVAIGKAIAAYAAAHPVIFGAAIGGLLGGVNAGISGTNIFQGIGIGILGGAIGGAVGMGVGNFLKGPLSWGKFWAGLGGAGLGGATAGAATSAALGGNVGLGALAGLAGGAAGFMGSYGIAPSVGYVMGSVASAGVTGGDLGQAALGGFIDASIVTTVGLVLPEPTIGEQGTPEGGDLIFNKGGGVTDPVGLFLSYLQGAPISHDAIAVSATQQVDSHVKGNGTRIRSIDYSRQSRLVKWAGTGNQKFIALAVQYGKDNAFKYWIGPRREVCSTFIGRTAKETGLSVPGFSPASQYYNIEGIPYHNLYRPKE
jgi:RHS repeat-associated protein